MHFITELLNQRLNGHLTMATPSLIQRKEIMIAILLALALQERKWWVFSSMKFRRPCFKCLSTPKRLLRSFFLSSPAGAAIDGMFSYSSCLSPLSLIGFTMSLPDSFLHKQSLRDFSTSVEHRMSTIPWF